MSSVAGYRGLPYAAAYCSSKSAITTFAIYFNQCKNLGIAIRVINPGFVKTPLTDKNKFKMPMIIPVEKAKQILCIKKLFFQKV